MFIFLVGLFLTGLVLYLLLLFDFLFIWSFLLVLFGGIFITGVVVDRFGRIKPDFSKPDNASEAQRTYTENFMNYAKNDQFTGGGS